MADDARLIDTSGKVDGCTARVADARHAVTAAVDRAQPQIAARGAALADAHPYRRMRLGPTYVRERVDLAGKVDGWTTRERSWGALATTLAGLPPEVDERWAVLAREARILMIVDVSRTVGGSWRDGDRAAAERPRLAPNAAVKRQGDVLVVPLDPGPFGAAVDPVAQIIESVWRSSALSIRVRWTSQATEPGAYRLALGGIAGQPSYVSSGRREVQLYPDVRAHSIAHEIGHVLGFSDRYVTKYDPARCVYTGELDPSDIMSDPDGAVTEADWAALAVAYPR